MEEKLQARSRKKKTSKARIWGIAGVFAVALAGIAAGAYIQIGQKYREVFFPNTTINGVEASGKTVEEVKRLIAAGIDGYTLTISERGGSTEQVTGEEIALQSVFDGSLEEILASQNPNEWLKHHGKANSHEIQTMIQYDEGLLEKRMGELDCLDEAKVTPPKDARLSEYTPGKGYSVIPEETGNEADPVKVREGISEALTNLREGISLEELGCYKAPAVLRTDAGLIGLADTLNRYVNTTVTYQFGNQTEVLPGSRIAEWLSVGEKREVSLDAGKAAEYVKELASKYDTYKNAKYLKTSYQGAEVRITGGMYGWRINQQKETEELINILNSGESQMREPVYAQRAASRGQNDYGDTYVEINLTAQHLFFYKNGKLVVESDFVSGNQSKGYDTPAGVYSITYKERNATLKGENYRTPVSYWMPFNGGIGLHDANWRSSFGGSIYKTSGSHGCVNLPPAVAKTIFENISAGVPVLCYHLAGTESGGSAAPAKPQETTAAVPSPSLPEETLPAESALPETPGQEPTEPTTGAPETPAAPPETPPQAGESGEIGPGIPGNVPTEPEIGPGV